MTSEAEQQALNELTAWTLGLRDGAFIHQHVVDAWALQHADEHSKPIAVALALIGLYLHLEKGYTGREVQRVHMRLGQPHGRGPGRKDWPRFPLPQERGSVTVRDVMAAPESERAAAIERWCRSVWEAWRSHALETVEMLAADLRRCRRWPRILEDKNIRALPGIRVHPRKVLKAVAGVRKVLRAGP